MVALNGYEEIISKIYKNDQDHIFKYWDELSIEEKKTFLEELNNIDFDLLVRLYKQKNEIPAKKMDFNPAQYVPIPDSDKAKKNYILAAKTGKDYILKGKVAVLLVAGGQGTRLGFSGPKGILPLSPVRNKSLFQIHAEKILKYSKKYSISIPWLIMTSAENHSETLKFFKKNKYFGLNEEDIMFFQQNMIPSLDLNGKLILKSKNSLSTNPDGHGGVLTALSTSGLLNELGNRKIETISYFQVDNPLVKILDPVFIGFHIMNRSDVSSKGVMKIDSTEKVGVFVKFENEKTGIVEYSDMPQEKQNAADANGKLLYCMGNIAIHLFNTTFIESIVSEGTLSLPYHIAKKKISSFSNGRQIDVDGFKYEKFIFDALTLTDKNTILETLRDEEFAPVKNAEGVDSIHTAREMMSNLHRGWITRRGINIPDNVKVVEISPLMATEADDIDENIKIPDREAVYLE